MIYYSTFGSQPTERLKYCCSSGSWREKGSRASAVMDHNFRMCRLQAWCNSRKTLSRRACKPVYWTNKTYYIEVNNNKHIYCNTNTIYYIILMTVGSPKCLTPGVKVPHGLIEPLHQEMIIPIVPLEVHIILQQTDYSFSIWTTMRSDFCIFFFDSCIKSKIVRDEKSSCFGRVKGSSTLSLL
jgi:hypothetical protein